MFRVFLVLVILYLIRNNCWCTTVIGNCRYFLRTGIYQCALSLTKYEGENDVIDIRGAHSNNHNDDRVEMLFNVDYIVMPVAPTIICKKYKNLQFLSIDNAGLERITENSFSSCPKLPQLDLHSNKLKEVTVEMFRETKELEYLNLATNEIGHIEGKSFERLPKLMDLFLNGNQLTELHKDTFAGLKSLRRLYLQENSISELPAAIFSDLVKLEYLDANHNQINRINPNFLGFFPSGTLTLHLQTNNCIDAKIAFCDNNGQEIQLLLEKCFQNDYEQQQLTTEADVLIEKIETKDDLIHNSQICSFDSATGNYSCKLSGIAILNDLEVLPPMMSWIKGLALMFLVLTVSIHSYRKYRQRSNAMNVSII